MLRISEYYFALGADTMIQRTASIPRSSSATPRNGRGPTRPPLPSNNSHRAANVPSKLAAEPRKNNAGRTAPANEGSISIRGAAGGPYVVVASNFAPGTTAADIESVMRSVGGDLQFCRLIAAQPTVIAEMGFPNAGDADKVIETFNNKRVSSQKNTLKGRANTHNLDRPTADFCTCITRTAA